MIVALWHRWTQDRRWRYLALCIAVLVADFFIGAWLIAWEIRIFKEVAFP